MRWRGMVFFLVGPLMVSACALIADLGDRTLGPIDGGSSSSTKDGSKKGDTDKEDSAAPADASPPLPSFCSGITLYASFDAKIAGDRGGESTLTFGGVTRTAQGKFGSALSLVHDPLNPDQGAALYYVATTAGNPWPENAGSLAVWYRQGAGTVWGTDPLAPVLYRPVGSLPTNPPTPLKTSGLAFYLNNDIGNVSGLYERSSADQAAVLVIGASTMTPYLRANDYNHYFTAWKKEITGPTAFFAINGGIGTAFTTPTTTYPDAAVDGELLTPYRSSTSRAWTSEGPPAGLRLGGLGTNTPDGQLDDLVIWNRVLTFAEAAAVFSANKAVGDVCALR